MDLGGHPGENGQSELSLNILTFSSETRKIGRKYAKKEERVTNELFQQAQSGALRARDAY